MKRLTRGRGPDPVRDAEREVREAQRELRRREKRERRRFSQTSRKRRLTWLVAGGAVGALALFVLVGVFTPIMGVRNIEVVGAQTLNVEEVEQALARFEGVPLALVGDGEVRNALETFPLIQRYALERVPPHTIRVRIEERVPVLSIAKDGAFQQFDAAGVLVGGSEAPAEGVPVADGAAADIDSEAFASAARILRDMPPEIRAQVTGVTATSGQDVLLTFGDELQVMWGGPEDTRRKTIVLTTMTASLEGKAVTYIDVSSTEAPIFR